MSIYAVFKLECLSVKTKLNPTALRFKLLTNATRSAFEKLLRKVSYKFSLSRKGILFLQLHVQVIY